MATDVRADRAPAQAAAPPGLRRPTALLFATAGALTVANVYFPQPLLDAIAAGLGVSDTAAGLVATAAQTGYALGIALVVPLADTARLRRLTTWLLALTTTGLLVAAAAPDLLTLTLATAALSTTTVLPQVLMPTAASLAGPAHGGRAVGLIGIGLTLGSTLSRTLSGTVAALGDDWRAAYLVAAALTGALIPVVPRALPERSPGGGARLPYGRLIASLPALLRTHPELRLSAFLGATVFGAFSAFWATLAFHLAAPPFALGPAGAGLFGLLTLPAALLSYRAGRLSDRRGPRYVNLTALGCCALAFAVMGPCGDSPAALVIGANLLVHGGACSQVANQVRIFRLPGEARARLNTVFMLASFCGGALGSLGGTALYARHGWAGLVLGCLALLALAGAGLFRGRRLG
ncbi:MFS transporter [Streptomyces omiyaensis]|uniref:MFS transporter n=1 Tax=Streptomyces omiyaensis TaxID=68247 RepID=A0ABW7BVT1_9ACTN|nr:MFS transporter [Streptomyces omiyaensis]GGY60549.1 MFS transporter [Streptomyces omiyaensis]